MIDLYTWPTPNGHKVHIMLEELELPYNVIPINIGEGDQFKPEFLKISPNRNPVGTATMFSDYKNIVIVDIDNGFAFNLTKI